MERVTATAAIGKSVLGTLARAHNFSVTIVSDRDYKRCAEVMISNFGSSAVGRAERHAREMLLDGDSDGHDIWTRVAAVIRQIR